MGNYLDNSETMTTEEASHTFGTFWILLMVVHCIRKAHVKKTRVPAEDTLNLLNPELTLVAAGMASDAQSARATLALAQDRNSDEKLLYSIMNCVLQNRFLKI